MGEWPEDTRAALCAEYAPRDPFAELAQGVISIGLFRILVSHLSAWTQLHEISAATYDQTVMSRYDFIRVNLAKGEVVPPQPEGFTRPWEVAERAKKVREEAEAVAASRDWFTQNVVPQLKM